MAVSNIIRLASMVTLVTAGLGILTVIFFWPLLALRMATIKLPAFYPASPVLSSVITGIIQFLISASHVLLLIHHDGYLYIHRKVFQPIRILIMPVMVAVMKSEAARNKEDIWYWEKQYSDNTTNTDTQTQTRTGTGTDTDRGITSSKINSALLMKSFSRNTRRHNKQKLKCYLESKIRSTTMHSDTLSLWKDIPIMIDHERRAVRGSNKSFLSEFIKRFLVVFMVTDGYIDRYYACTPPRGSSSNDDDTTRACTDGGNFDIDNERPIAFSIFARSGQVLHSLMYFCREEYNQSGIWHYQMLRMMLRTAAASSTPYYDNPTDPSMTMSSSSSSAPSTPLLTQELSQSQSSAPKVKYVNFLDHLDYAKKCVGAKNVAFDHESLLMRDLLYPFQLFQEPPEHIVHMELNVAAMLE